MVKLGDLFIGNAPHTREQLVGWHISWQRVWTASAALGAAAAYDAYRRKDWKMLALFVADSGFSLYKMRQQGNQLRAFALGSPTP